MIEPARHTKIALLGSGSVMLWRCAEWITSLVSFCDWLTDKQTNNCQHPWVYQPTRLIILQSAMTHLPGFAPPQGAVQRKTYLCLWQIPPAREQRGLDSSGNTRQHHPVQFFPSGRCANILAHDKPFPAVDKLEDATCIGISESVRLCIHAKPPVFLSQSFGNRLYRIGGELHGRGSMGFFLLVWPVAKPFCWPNVDKHTASDKDLEWNQGAMEVLVFAWRGFGAESAKHSRKRWASVGGSELQTSGTSDLPCWPWYLM